MSNNTEKFSYSYSAPTEAERREIELIRSHYSAPKDDESKLRRLRALDSHVRSIPKILALSVGIIGTLIFGIGLTMILEWNLVAWGIVTCALSLPPIALAKPIHSIALKKAKDKFSPEILRLSEELLGKNENES